MTPEIKLGPCTCGHSVFLHDIRKNKTRSRCYFITGPRGIQCTCPNFREAQ